MGDAGLRIDKTSENKATVKRILLSPGPKVAAGRADYIASPAKAEANSITRIFETMTSGFPTPWASSGSLSRRGAGAGGIGRGLRGS